MSASLPDYVAAALATQPYSVPKTVVKEVVELLEACAFAPRPALYARSDHTVLVQWHELDCVVATQADTTTACLTLQRPRKETVSREALVEAVREHVGTKRDRFRRDLTIALDLLAEREQYNPTHDPEFDEANFPTPLFIYNVACFCHPFHPLLIDRLRRHGHSLDEIQSACEEPETLLPTLLAQLTPSPVRVEEDVVANPESVYESDSAATPELLDPPPQGGRLERRERQRSKTLTPAVAARKKGVRAQSCRR